MDVLFFLWGTQAAMQYPRQHDDTPYYIIDFAHCMSRRPLLLLANAHLRFGAVRETSIMLPPLTFAAKSLGKIWRISLPSFCSFTFCKQNKLLPTASCRLAGRQHCLLWQWQLEAHRKRTIRGSMNVDNKNQGSTFYGNNVKRNACGRNA